MSAEESKLLNEFIAVGLARYPEALTTLEKFREEIIRLLTEALTAELVAAGLTKAIPKFEPGRGADWISVFTSISLPNKKTIRLEVGVKWESHNDGPAKLLFRLYDCASIFDILTDHAYPKPIQEWYRDGKKQSVHLCLPLAKDDLKNIGARLQFLVTSCLKALPA